MRRLLVAVVAALGIASAVASAAPPSADVRFATFNASLNRGTAGLLQAQLSEPAVDDVFRRQIRNVAEVVQRVRPDVLLVNEFDPLQNGDVDVAPGPENLFRSSFLEVGQVGAAPIDYDYAFIAASNTGVFSGKDLNGDGVVGTTPGTAAYANDAYGLRLLPGPVRDGRLLEISHRLRRRAHLPEVPLGGHARQPDPEAVLLS